MSEDKRKREEMPEDTILTLALIKYTAFVTVVVFSLLTVLYGCQFEFNYSYDSNNNKAVIKDEQKK